MVLGLSLAAFTRLHVVISLVGIAGGLVFLGALVGGRWLRFRNAIFLVFTILTSATGFLFPPKPIGPPFIFGLVSLALLAVALLALHVGKARGGWRMVHIATALIAQWLNMVVLVVQSFQKIPPLHALAPLGNEPPVQAAQAAQAAVAAVALIVLHAAWKTLRTRASRAATAQAAAAWAGRLPPLAVVALMTDVGAGAVLHPVDAGALVPGQARPVGAAPRLVAGDMRLLALEPVCLARRQRARAHAVVDARLLVVLAAVDLRLGRAGRGGGDGGGDERGGEDPDTHDCVSE